MNIPLTVPEPRGDSHPVAEILATAAELMQWTKCGIDISMGMEGPNPYVGTCVIPDLVACIDGAASGKRLLSDKHEHPQPVTGADWAVAELTAAEFVEVGENTEEASSAACAMVAAHVGVLPYPPEKTAVRLALRVWQAGYRDGAYSTPVRTLVEVAERARTLQENGDLHYTPPNQN